MIALLFAAAAAGDLDLALPGDRPAVVRVRVDIDGRTVSELWDEAFARLAAFHDRDGDGALDKAEAGRLPGPFGLRQILWGQFVPLGGSPPAWADLDRDGDGRARPDEVAGYYRRAGLGGVLVGVGTPPDAARLTAAVREHLDADGDGRLTEAEWRDAPRSLGRLDRNGDELIGPGELVAGAAYPGATGCTLLGPGGGAFPLAASPARGGVPAAHWSVRLGAGGPAAEAAAVTGPDGTRLELRADEGRLPGLWAAGRRGFLAAFAEADADRDGTVTAAEAARAGPGGPKLWLAAADRDGDGRLTRAERDAWLGVVDGFARAHVLLTVLDHGRGLFELIDADRDGSLSVRELRGAWGRASAGEPPRLLAATASRGHPVAALGMARSAGPAWFRAMDRNGDGDVSRGEFTGPAAAFDRLDADRDGLVDAAEAGRPTPAAGAARGP